MNFLIYCSEYTKSQSCKMLDHVCEEPAMLTHSECEKYYPAAPLHTATYTTVSERRKLTTSPFDWVFSKLNQKLEIIYNPFVFIVWSWANLWWYYAVHCGNSESMPVSLHTEPQKPHQQWSIYTWFHPFLFVIFRRTRSDQQNCESHGPIKIRFQMKEY